jgi:hypothetical protein
MYTVLKVTTKFSLQDNFYLLFFFDTMYNWLTKAYGPVVTSAYLGCDILKTL